MTRESSKKREKVGGKKFIPYDEACAVV